MINLTLPFLPGLEYFRTADCCTDVTACSVVFIVLCVYFDIQSVNRQQST